MESNQVNNAIIEKKSIMEVGLLMLSDHRLDPHLNSDDKVAFTDGSVDVYSDDKSRKKSKLLYRVDLQIKGTTSRLPRKASFSIQREWLEYYAENGGVVFITAFMDEEAEIIKGIFYRSFTPAQARVLLKQFSSKAKSKKVRLTKLKKETVHDVLVKFHKDTEVYSKSMPIRHISTIDLRQLSDVRLDIPIGEEKTGLLDKDMVYLSAKIGEVTQMIQWGNDDFIQIKLLDTVNLKFPNEEETIGVIERMKNKFIVQLYDGIIRFVFAESKNGTSVTIEWNFEKTNKTIEAKETAVNVAENLYSALMSQKIWVLRGENQILIPLKSSEEERAGVSELYTQIDRMKREIWLSSLMNLDIANTEFDQKSLSTVNALLRLYTPTEEDKKKLGIVIRVSVNEKFYYFTFFDGKLKNLFSDDSGFGLGKVAVGNGGKEQRTEEMLADVNPYVLLEDSIQDMPQYNLDVILKNNDFKITEKTPEWYVSSYNATVLQFINMYDQTDEMIWLDAADSFINQVEEVNDQLSEILLLNSAQIEKRRGMLSFGTRKTILGIKENSTNEFARLSAAILLSDRPEMLRLWETLDSDGRTAVKNWPIYRLIDKPDEFV